MTLKLLLRVLTPRPLVSLYYLLKYRCRISPRAEVELSPLLKIGRRTNIGSFTKIKASRGTLSIGNDVTIGNGCHIDSGQGGVVVGDDCLIGPHVRIIGTNYRYDRLDIPIRSQELTSKGTTIANNVWVGAGTCILDGANIGEGAIVTAGSVVSGTVPENAIVQGNPAKVILVRR